MIILYLKEFFILKFNKWIIIRIYLKQQEYKAIYNKTCYNEILSDSL